MKRTNPSLLYDYAPHLEPPSLSNRREEYGTLNTFVIHHGSDSTRNQPINTVDELHLGDDCMLPHTRFQQCPAGAECRGGLCQCTNDHVQMSETCVQRETGKAIVRRHLLSLTSVPYRVLNPGDYCSDIDFCDGGSACKNSVCQCVDGFVPQGRTCAAIGYDGRLDQSTSL